MSDESGCRRRHGSTRRMRKCFTQRSGKFQAAYLDRFLLEVMCWQWSAGQIRRRARNEREGCLAEMATGSKAGVDKIATCRWGSIPLPPSRR
jgi:hypothetical protein